MGHLSTESTQAATEPLFHLSFTEAAQDSGPTADSRDPYRTLGTSPEPVVHPSPTARTDRGLEEEAPRSP
ncbi:hypothetical protein QR680_012978 [Steinernema hermaphroditum]|uniref:Uncharacterized protein n=1 Tax=Steinernema hermaphroditum TaxID=289476 RepID=A0AA39I6J3_9BILA|nr:hypothetical protein QR680_012978 [Steinernema hermaphroditum]